MYMSNTNAVMEKLGVQNAVQASRFEKELRDAIEKRKGKAPLVPQDKVDKFVRDSIRLRFKPDWKMAATILGRIIDAELYLLSDGNPEQYSARLRPQPEDQLGEHSADADAGTQADAAAGVEASDSPLVVQSDPVGPDVTTQDAEERGTPEHEEPTSSPDATPCPEKLVPDFPLDLLDDKAGTESRELNEQVVEEYEEHWKSGGTFPPILVYQHGDHHFLADGFHRTRPVRVKLA
jgi:hypothetical protein